MEQNAVDFTNDKNPDLLMWLNSRGAIPDYVLDTERMESEDFSKMASVAFADPYNRLYPIDTPASTWLSTAHFMGRGCTDDAVFANLEKAAAMHGISDDIEELARTFAESQIEKQASADTAEPKYALSMVDDSGNNINCYPVNCDFEIIGSGEKAASDYRSKELPLATFAKVATALMDEAAAHGVEAYEMPADVVKFGVRRLPDPYTAETLITMRKAAGIDVAPYMLLLGALREGLEKAASVDVGRNIAFDTAERMSRIDAAHNLTYGSRMPDPFSAIFSGPPEADLEKFASTHVRINGVNVPTFDLLNLNDNRLDASFSQKAALTIKQAKAMVSGECDMEKCANASDKLATLSPEAQKVLLATLAGVAW